MTASELILQKALVGSDLDSAQWNQVQAGFRNRAFFSSRVAEVNILAAMRERTAEYAQGGTDISKIRMQMREDLRRMHYEPRPGEENTIKDLFTQSRLDVIIKTNVAQARGYMQYAEGMSPGAFAAFPAQEFVRVRHSRHPRTDWPQRWAKAGGKMHGGKMIAMKDDPVWKRLGELGPFGNSYPPFDWGSGMGVMDVDRAEAEWLGLVTREELRSKVQQLREKPLPDFNRDMQATVPQTALKTTRDILGEDFGDLVKIDDNGTVKWRPEILKETLLQGKDFNMKIGKPQKGLLDMMRSNPKLEPFADAIDGKQLFVNQDWRDTKRPDGTTHLAHFYPIEEYPEDIPLVPEDMEMLPTMWHKPDRVHKRDAHVFTAELDAFDGSTYVMQIGFKKDGNPKLWTFFKTTLPTSKKLARTPAAPLPTHGRNQRA